MNQRKTRPRDVQVKEEGRAGEGDEDEAAGDIMQNWMSSWKAYGSIGCSWAIFRRIRPIMSERRLCFCALRMM
jgi:hypothetical protein